MIGQIKGNVERKVSREKKEKMEEGEDTEEEEEEEKQSRNTWPGETASFKGSHRVLEQAGIARRICPGLCPGLQLLGQVERERAFRLSAQDKGLVRSHRLSPSIGA